MRPERRALFAVLGALAVAGAVILVIAVFGLRDIPKFPALADHPDPAITGVVAYVERSEDNGTRCIKLVDAAGGPVRPVPCDKVSSTGGLAFTPDGRLQVRRFDSSSPSNHTVLVDPATGEITPQTTLPLRIGGALTFGGSSAPVVRGTFERPDGSTVRVRHTDGHPEIRIAGGSNPRTVLKVKAPRDYDFSNVSWSPDGRWILVVDSEQRLIVVAADGPPRPRILARNVVDPVWYQPGQ